MLPQSGDAWLELDGCVEGGGGVCVCVGGDH